MSTAPGMIDVSQAPAALGPGLRRLAAVVRETVGDELLGLTIYGRALDSADPAGEFSAQSVMVVRKVDLSAFRRLGEHGPELGRWQLAAPLAMTPEDIQASTDTFPLELLEVSQRRLTLAGRDFFADVEFRPEHVRLQCEREFRRIRLRLLQGVLIAVGREAALAALEQDVGQHVLRVLRGYLWLKGERAFLPAEDVLQRCGAFCGRPLHGIRRAVRASGEHGWEECIQLHDDAEALAAICNEL